MSSKQKKAASVAGERQDNNSGQASLLSINNDTSMGENVQSDPLPTACSSINICYTGSLDLPEIVANLDLFNLLYDIMPDADNAARITVYVDNVMPNTGIYEYYKDQLSMIADPTYKADKKSWDIDPNAAERPAVFEPINQRNGDLYTTSEAPNLPNKGRQSVSASSLYQADLPEITFFIDKILPQGLGIVAGEAKVGKSQFMLQAANDIAEGVPFLQSTSSERPFQGFDTVKVPVIYYSLEMAENLLQQRFRSMHPRGGVSDHLHFYFDLPRFDENGLDQMQADIKEKGARVVIVDTFGKVSSSKSSQKELYEQAYTEMDMLQKIAEIHDCSIILITHLNKSTDSSNFTRIIGSTANRGAADFNIILSKSEGQILMNEESRKAEGLEIILEMGHKPMKFEFISTADDMQKEKWREQYLTDPIANAVKYALRSQNTVTLSASEIRDLLPDWAAEKYSPQKVGTHIVKIKNNLKFYDEITFDRDRNMSKRGYKFTKPRGKELTPIMGDFIRPVEQKNDLDEDAQTILPITGMTAKKAISE